MPAAISCAMRFSIAFLALLLHLGARAHAALPAAQEEAARALLRPVCNDPKARAELVEGLEQQEPAYRKAAVKWDVDTACAQVDLPLTPIYDTADPSPSATHTSSVYGVHWSADGQRIASASADGTVRIWDAATGKTVSLIQTPAIKQFAGALGPGTVRSAIFAGTGSLVAVGADAQPVILYDTATGQPAATVPFNKLNPNERLPPYMAATAAGLLFMAGYSDDVVAFDTIRLSVRHRLPGHAPEATAVAVSEAAGLVATGTGSEKFARVTLWKVATGEKVAAVEATGSRRPNALAFSRDGRYLALASGGSIMIYATADQKLLQTIAVHPFNGILDAVFTTDGKGIISCASHPILWDIASGKLVRHFGGLSDLCYSVSVSPDGRFAVTGSTGSDARVWEIATGRFYRRLGADVQPLR